MELYGLHQAQRLINTATNGLQNKGQQQAYTSASAMTKSPALWVLHCIEA
jgi:hypothetical protein